MTTEGRLAKEYTDMLNKKEFKVWQVNNDIRHWKGVIDGPSDSIYANGKFQVDIKIVGKYPYVPPKIQFDTKIWHPNISSVTGAICLDILKDEWSPALSIRTAMLSIQALLTAAEPDDPQDAVVAKQYKENRPEFDKTAREWTLKFANENSLKQDKIAKITEMGFTEDEAIKALEKVGWDENEAIQMLIN